MVLLPAEVAMAAPYSMDLRKRVLKAWDASGDADDVAATFGVSRAWVHRLAQRHRETGSIAPRAQTKFRSRVLAGQEERLKALVNARPDATLAELRDALPTTAALSTLWLELDRLNLTVKKKPYTPTNSVDLMSPPRAGSGARRNRSTRRATMSSSTNPA
jgi:transposase